jgi:hypothetical protein
MFDRHWWLKRDISEAELQRTRILEPKVKPRKKRQSKTGLRIPSGFEFTDLNHVASRRPREFPDPPPPLLPSRNPTPSVPASQPLVQDRTQRHLEVSQQQTAHISSHIHPLEPRLTQSTSFQHQTVPVQQLHYWQGNIQRNIPLEPSEYTAKPGCLPFKPAFVLHR